MKRLVARFDKRSRITKITSICARDGEIFRKELHLFSGTLKDAKDKVIESYKTRIVIIAKSCFPFWIDGGFSFEQKSYPKSNAISVFFNSSNKIIGFNLYRLGIYSGFNYLYADYVGVDASMGKDNKPLYRRRGLWQSCVSDDLELLQPDIYFASSAASELHLAIRTISKERDRFVYPIKKTVPAAIALLAKKLYGNVTSQIEALKIEDTTLIKRNDSLPFTQGLAPYPLFQQLNLQSNDGIILLSLSKECHELILASNLDTP